MCCKRSIVSVSLLLCCSLAASTEGPASPKTLHELACARFAARDWPGFHALWSPASRQAMADDRRAWIAAFPRQSADAQRAQLAALSAATFEEARRLALPVWSGRLAAAADAAQGGPFGKTAGFVSARQVEGRTLIQVRYLAREWPHKRTHELAAVKLGGAWYLRAAGAGPEIDGAYVRGALTRLFGELLGGKLDPKQLQPALDRMFDGAVRETFAVELRGSDASRKQALARTDRAIAGQLAEAERRRLELPVPVIKLVERKRSGKQWGLLPALVLQHMLGQALAGR